MVPAVAIHFKKAKKDAVLPNIDKEYFVVVKSDDAGMPSRLFTSDAEAAQFVNTCGAAGKACEMNIFYSLADAVEALKEEGTRNAVHNGEANNNHNNVNNETDDDEEESSDDGDEDDDSEEVKGPSRNTIANTSAIRDAFASQLGKGKCLLRITAFPPVTKNQKKMVVVFQFLYGNGLPYWFFKPEIIASAFSESAAGAVPDLVEMRNDCFRTFQFGPLRKEPCGSNIPKRNKSQYPIHVLYGYLSVSAFNGGVEERAHRLGESFKSLFASTQFQEVYKIGVEALSDKLAKHDPGEFYHDIQESIVEVRVQGSLDTLLLNENIVDMLAVCFTDPRKPKAIKYGFSSGRMPRDLV